MSSDLAYRIDITIINKSDYLCIIFPSLEKLTNFKYEIFGNKNFFLSGKIEKNSNSETRILFEVPEDTNFLIKIVAYNKCKNNYDLFFKFINYECRFNGDRNLTMEILKKEQINSDMKSSRLLTNKDLDDLKCLDSLNTNLVDISNSINDSNEDSNDDSNTDSNSDSNSEPSDNEDNENDS